MSVVVIGLQHTQAPLPLLEAAAVSDADLHKVLSALSHRRNIQEAVVLSTCLRTEVYAVVDRFHDAVAEIYDVLSEHSGLSVEELSAHATVRFDDDVTSHLFSVTSGLESVVTGETEVVGQVRRAFERAQEEGTSGPGPLRPVPARAADGQAGAHRDRDQQGDHVVRLRRGGGGPRRGPDGVARRARRRGRRGRHGPRGLPRPVGHRAGRCARCASSWSTARRRGRATWCARRRPGPFEMRAAPLERVAGELADADVVLTAVAAESHVLDAAGLRRRRPARCW